MGKNAPDGHDSTVRPPPRQATQAASEVTIKEGASKVAVVVAVITAAATVLVALINLASPVIESITITRGDPNNEKCRESLPRAWTPELQGNWDPQHGISLARFTGRPSETGIYLASGLFRSGRMDTSALISELGSRCSIGLVFDFDSGSGDFQAAGINLDSYWMAKFDPTSSVGQKQSRPRGGPLLPNHRIEFGLDLKKDRGTLEINNVPVYNFSYQSRSGEPQIGLYVSDCQIVEFGCTQVCPD